jgi:hypothetical protein
MNMNLDTTHQEAGDLEACAREGRKPQATGPYRILVGNDRLEFESYQIDDPIVTGRQLLDLVRCRPADEHILFQLLHDGLLEEIRLEETTDLREQRIEKFIVFRSDRSFRFLLDGRQFEWGGACITGLTLKRLAEVDSATHGVWLVVRGGDDKKIGNDELVDLSKPGVEKFFTGIDQTTEG